MDTSLAHPYGGFIDQLNDLEWTTIPAGVAADLTTDDIGEFARLIFGLGIWPTILRIESDRIVVVLYKKDFPRLVGLGLRLPVSAGVRHQHDAVAAYTNNATHNNVMHI
jgi:hypothetical protein